MTSAPTCPMPASLWAIPVLITGAIPLSTHFRTTIPAGVLVKSMAESVKDGFGSQGDGSHLLCLPQNFGDRPSDELNHCGGCRHGDPSQTRDFRYRTVPKIGRGIFNCVGREEKALNGRYRCDKPLISGSADTNPKFNPIVPGHRRDHETVRYPVGRVEHFLAGGHGDIEKKIAVVHKEINGGAQSHFSPITGEEAWE